MWPRKSRLVKFLNEKRKPTMNRLFLFVVFICCSFIMTLSLGSRAFSHVTEDTQNAPKEVCLGCHGSYQEIAKLTSDLDLNPHNSHLGQMRCTVCHKPDGKIDFYCAKCHINYDYQEPK